MGTITTLQDVFDTIAEIRRASSNPQLSSDRRRTLDDGITQLYYLLLSFQAQYQLLGEEDQEELNPGLRECREQLITCLRPNKFTSAELATQLHSAEISFVQPWALKRGP